MSSKPKVRKRPKHRGSRQARRRGKLTQYQLERNKRTALRATSELTKAKAAEDNDEETSEHTASGTDSDTSEALGEILPGVIPRQADILE